MLTPCRECHRHVRSGDQACPFCGTRTTNLLRGVRNVAAAAAILSIGACGNDEAQRTADIYGGPPAPSPEERPLEPEDPEVDVDDTPDERLVNPVPVAPAYGGPPEPPPTPPPSPTPASPDPGAPEATPGPETSEMRQRQPAVYGGPPVRRNRAPREPDILDGDE